MIITRRAKWRFLPRMGRFTTFKGPRDYPERRPYRGFDRVFSAGPMRSSLSKEPTSGERNAQFVLTGRSSITTCGIFTLWPTVCSKNACFRPIMGEAMEKGTERVPRVRILFGPYLSRYSVFSSKEFCQKAAFAAQNAVMCVRAS
jgi:hypothetical protein